MDEVEITIIGAGVIGLAIAAELSKRSESVVVLERHETFGQETSSRNSEVVHSGIYYPEGSLKAKLCVEGAERLYDFCEKNSVRFLRIGKLILAADRSEVPCLNELIARGVQNGARGLRILEENDIRRLEPNVSAVSAIYSPNTGILDSHSFMNRLYNAARSEGVVFSFDSPVESIERTGRGYRIGIRGEEYRFISKVIINSAGLFSNSVAKMAGLDTESEGYGLRYCKGSYFSYGRKSPVNRLIYPAPHADLTGLGVHATLDLCGRLRFGPDAEYVGSIDYRVDPGKRDMFYESASRMIRGLDRNMFSPDSAGIRPKIKGEGIKDFVILHEKDKGLEGFINLAGIESPGLTASLSIARVVAEMAGGIL